MTVAELRKALDQVPAEYEVFFGDEEGLWFSPSDRWPYECRIDLDGFHDERPADDAE